MNKEKSFLVSQLVVMSKADLEALMEEKLTLKANALKVEVNSTGDGTCLGEKNDERFLTREETAKLLHVDYSTLWRWHKLGLLCPNKVGPRRVMYKYSDVLKKLNGEG